MEKFTKIISKAIPLAIENIDTFSGLTRDSVFLTKIDTVQ